MSWFLIAAQAIISGVGVLLLRFASQRFTGLTTSSFQVYLVGTIGFLAYAASFALWVLILSKTQATYAFPVTIGMSLLVTTLGAVFIFQERITAAQGIGIALLVAAVGLISVFGNAR